MSKLMMNDKLDGNYKWRISVRREELIREKTKQDRIALYNETIGTLNSINISEYI